MAEAARAAEASSHARPAGSVEYKREMARVLATRALKQQSSAREVSDMARTRSR